MEPERHPSPAHGAPRALRLARGLRAAILIACVLAAAAAWALAAPTALALALVIAAEEVIETSVVIGALRMHPGPAPRWHGGTLAAPRLLPR